MDRPFANPSAMLLAMTFVRGCASREPDVAAPNSRRAAQHEDDRTECEVSSQVAGAAESEEPTNSEPVRAFGSGSRAAKLFEELTAEKLQQTIEDSRTDPAFEAAAPQSADAADAESSEPPGPVDAARPE